MSSFRGVSQLSYPPHVVTILIMLAEIQPPPQELLGGEQAYEFILSQITLKERFKEASFHLSNPNVNVTKCYNTKYQIDPAFANGTRKTLINNERICKFFI